MSSTTRNQFRPDAPPRDLVQVGRESGMSNHQKRSVLSVTRNVRPDHGIPVRMGGTRPVEETDSPVVKSVFLYTQKRSGGQVCPVVRVL